MGFINPFLYNLKAGTLLDVTEGAAIGCNGVNSQSGDPIPGGGIIPYATWNATRGWDPVTGLGLPDFQKLMKEALEAC
jgi:tripeptidyl-peptidase-1